MYYLYLSPFVVAIFSSLAFCLIGLDLIEDVGGAIVRN